MCKKSKYKKTCKNGKVPEGKNGRCIQVNKKICEKLKFIEKNDSLEQQTEQTENVMDKPDEKTIQKNALSESNVNLMKDMTVQVLENLKKLPQLKDKRTRTYPYLPDSEIEFENKVMNNQIIESSLKKCSVKILFNIAHVIYNNLFEELEESFKTKMDEKEYSLLFEKRSLTAWNSLYKYNSFGGNLYVPLELKNKKIDDDVEIITVDSLIELLNSDHYSTGMLK
jgi:hypothetical protein